MENKLKVVIPSYNNQDWVKINLESILEQDYQNYEVLYINDCSTDDTKKLVEEMVGKNPKFNIHTNEKNMKRGYNIAPNNLEHFFDNDEDILVFIDGDDWLPTPDVFSKLNDFYNKQRCWMTYGGMVCWSGGEDVTPANPQNSSYPYNVQSDKLYRKDLWRASHLRTFKWFLYKEIKDSDLRYSKTNEYYFHAEDLASSYPCLEMCPTHKIGVVDFVSYVFNAYPSNRARGVERENNAGMELESEIRNQEAYKTLQVEEDDKYVVPTLSGGLGNMMFQIAASIGLSKYSNHKVKIDYKHIGTLHTPPIEYENNIFKKVSKLTEQVDLQDFNVDNFHYEEVSLPQNDIKLNGYFQSEKYFQHCKEEIIDLFLPEDERPTRKGYVSLHIRRGNYVNLSEFHHNVELQYYLNAIKHFDGYNFLVFSDDIDWCRKNFIGDNFKFIEGQTDIQDLYMMAECEHNIIANSTFSWWGAYLNKNPNKIVIYPDKWFGKANSHLITDDIFPSNWLCFSETEVVEMNRFDSNISHAPSIKEAGLYCGVRDRKPSLIEGPENVKWVNSLSTFDGITMFTDKHFNKHLINSVNSNHKVAVIFEPISVDPNAYSSILDVEDDLDFIFTYNRDLLERNPQKYKFYPADWVCIEKESHNLHNKNKLVSMIYSNKGGIDRVLRHDVGQKFSSKMDLYGGGSPNGELIMKSKSLNDYMFSVVMENSISDYYYTEKIIDAFCTGNIPIYRGSDTISKFFDKRGIIMWSTFDELDNILTNLSEKQYMDMLPYVRTNYEIAVNNYMNPDDQLLRLTNLCVNDKDFDTMGEFLYER